MTTADVLAAPCVPEPYVMIKNANDVNKLYWKIIFFMEKNSWESTFVRGDQRTEYVFKPQIQP